MGNELSNIFNSININIDEESDAPFYTVEPVKGFTNYFVGKNQDEYACLLVRTINQGKRIQPAIRLENLEVQFGIPCTIQKDGQKSEEGTFTVISCRRSEPVTIRYFFSVCKTILNLVGDNPNHTALSSSVIRLAELFQKIQMPPSRSLNGLFGELVIIKVSSDPVKTLNAWRNENIARYDFSENDIRIDVKASATRNRIHGFSFEQCSPPPSTKAIVASIFVERSANGYSMRSLVEEIERKISSHPELIFKLRDVVAGTLGSSLNDALEARFDIELAESSIMFFDFTEVPAIRGELPIGVSNVHFNSDLSTLPPQRIDQLIDIDPHFWELLPPIG